MAPRVGLPPVSGRNSLRPYNLGPRHSIISLNRIIAPSNDLSPCSISQLILPSPMLLSSLLTSFEQEQTVALVGQEAG
jgi:hypothetical protein